MKTLYKYKGFVRENYRETRRVKGLIFVEASNDEEATEKIKKWLGEKRWVYDMDDIQITVEEVPSI